MAEVILDRMLWLPRDEVDEPRIIRDLTIFPRTYLGEPDPLKLYEFTPSHIGVPRRWGMMHLKEYITKVVDKTTYPHMLWPELVWPTVDGVKWDYKSGQREAVTTIVEKFTSGFYGGLLDMPCGGGKTFCALKVAEEMQTPALILVHKSDLARQWWRTGTLGDDEKSIPPLWPGSKYGHVQQDCFRFIGCHYVTAMAQTLLSRMDSIPEEFWKYFGMLIVDEGHLYAARTLETVIRKIYARYRLFISATWRRSDGCECIWHYHAGSVLAKPTVSRLVGQYKQILWKTNLRDKDHYFRGAGKKVHAPSWVSSIAENNLYNHWIIKQMMESSKVGRRMLVVSGRREHCFELKRLFMTAMVTVGRVPDIGVYVGDAPGAKTTEFEKRVSKERQNIVSTYKMIKLGTDIPQLDTILLATPESDVEQTVGRIQRDFGDKKPLLIIDPVFDSPWNRNLAEKRRTTYDRLGFRKQE